MKKSRFTDSQILAIIRTSQGWSYLACVLDLGSKEIAGWAMSKQPNAQLAKTALSL